LQERLDPLVVSWGWPETEFVKRHGWQGTRDPAAFLSVPAAIEFQRERGWDAVRDRCHALVERFVAECGLPSSATEFGQIVEVEVRHEGVSGFGEAAPVDTYDESAESALAYVEAVGEELGDDPFALEEVMQRLPAEQFAARAAIDAALHDLCGKLVGEPAWR